MSTDAMQSRIRDAYLQAAESAAGLLGDPAVAAQWTRPSALAEFRVSGLAGHLGAQVLSVVRVLDEPLTDRPPETLLGHYERGDWIDARVDDEVNVGIRSSGEEVAAGGAAGLTADVESAAISLRTTLPAEPADRVVQLPGRWALHLDDYLLTRMMEVAVHSDDLAVSVDVPTPALPPEVLEPVVLLLANLAIRRHGQPAVLRAFSRSERAPASIAAF